MAKKTYAIGNWKMNKSSREATDYLEQLLPLVKDSSTTVCLSVPFTSIAQASNFAKDTNVVIGAQNMNDVREGAFTGEIAGLMLKEAGAEFVLLGHSERRHIFGETDEFIHRKVIRALQDDIQPVLCVGETLEQRDAGQAKRVLMSQISIALDGVPKEDLARLILAYEPVWAIGTGRAATEEMIAEAHKFCLDAIEKLFGKRASADVPVLYGGSVKAENTSGIMAQKGVDGVLVGGASLDPKTFAKIVNEVGS